MLVRSSGHRPDRGTVRIYSKSLRAIHTAGAGDNGCQGRHAKAHQAPAVTAMRERQKKCGAEWKAAKAAGTVENGQKWPQYWSACNKRLKAAS